MGIIQWIKKLFRRDEIKQIEETKSNKFGDWKADLHYEANNDEVVEKLTKEQLRTKQIKEIEDFVLYKSGYLKKEDIWKKINNKYEEIVLQDVDMQALIVIYAAIKEEDQKGDCNIRDFIDDEENNIVKLVNKLIEKAEEEAEKYNEMDISKLIIGSKESINKLIKEIDENKISEEESEQEQI